jgi:hypothetical protein
MTDIGTFPIYSFPTYTFPTYTWPIAGTFTPFLFAEHYDLDVILNRTLNFSPIMNRTLNFSPIMNRTLSFTYEELDDL